MKKMLILVMFSLMVVGFAYADDDDDDYMRYRNLESFCPDGKHVEYSVAVNKVQQILKKKYPKYYIEDVDIEYTVYKIEAEKQGFGADLVFIVDICTGDVQGPYKDY